ncbi:hypothetical protein COO60DRAFT_1660458 [Scenedesmus sp. NREL 46B-D3]|nr:hypothetical protein COO60DRAFT_1660458 [Scenedesmus sp. NREL 46B-D3]
MVSPATSAGAAAAAPAAGALLQMLTASNGSSSVSRCDSSVSGHAGSLGVPPTTPQPGTQAPGSPSNAAAAAAAAAAPKSNSKEALLQLALHCMPLWEAKRLVRCSTYMSSARATAYTREAAACMVFRTDLNSYGKGSSSSSSRSSVEVGEVRKRYRALMLTVHPDKVPQGLKEVAQLQDFLHRLDVAADTPEAGGDGGGGGGSSSSKKQLLLPATPCLQLWEARRLMRCGGHMPARVYGVVTPMHKAVVRVTLRLDVAGSSGSSSRHSSRVAAAEANKQYKQLALAVLPDKVPLELQGCERVAAAFPEDFKVLQSARHLLLGCAR